MDFDETAMVDAGAAGAADGEDQTSAELTLSDLVQWNFSVTSETPPSDAIISWYSNLPSTRLDLVGELGDSRGLFIVHGESLITHILSTHLPSFSTDLSYLSAVYYFERYLSVFVKAKGGHALTSVKIVFFDCCKFRLNESEILLREILISHLTKNLPKSVVHVFTDWTSDDFAHFIKLTDISSFIVSDDIGQEEVEEDDQVNMMIQHMYLALSLSLVTVSRVRIAFLDQLEQRGHRVVAMSVGSERRHEQVNALVTDIMQPVVEETRSEQQDEASPEATSTPLISAIAQSIADLEDVTADESRIPLVVLKTILIASHVQRHISLDDRAHASVENWEIFQLDGFVLQIWSQVAIHLAPLIRNSTVDVSDIFDGRLFRTIFYCLWSANAFSQKTVNPRQVLGIDGVAIESDWSKICADLPTKSSVFDLQLQIDIAAPEHISASPQRSHRVPQFVQLGSFPLINRATFVASVDPMGQTVAKKLSLVDIVPPPAVAGSKPGSYIPETQLVTRRFEEKKKRDYEEQKLKWKHLSIDKLAGRMRNWELRGAQKELRAMHQYAKSLVGADCLHHPIALVQDTSRKGGKPSSTPAPVVDTEETPAPVSGGPKLSKKAQEIIAKNVAAQQKVQAIKIRIRSNHCWNELKRLQKSETLNRSRLRSLIFALVTVES